MLKSVTHISTLLRDKSLRKQALFGAVSTAMLVSIGGQVALADAVKIEHRSTPTTNRNQSDFTFHPSYLPLLEQVQRDLQNLNGTRQPSVGATGARDSQSKPNAAHNERTSQENYADKTVPVQSRPEENREFEGCRDRGSSYGFCHYVYCGNHGDPNQCD